MLFIVALIIGLVVAFLDLLYQMHNHVMKYIFQTPGHRLVTIKEDEPNIHGMADGGSCTNRGSGTDGM